MNYLILKSVIESTIAHFACRNCGNKVGEKDVRVAELTSNAVNLEIICPVCNADGMVKAEIGMYGENGNSNTPQYPTAANAKELLENLEKMLAENALKWKPQANIAPSWDASIKDEDILELRKKMKDSLSAEDLFN